MNQRIFTAYRCDRCNNNNAVRLRLRINEGKFKEVDMCSACVLQFASLMFDRMDSETKEAWLQSFIEGSIV